MVVNWTAKVCLFCESLDLRIGNAEALGYWVYCHDCGSAGPTKETSEEAQDAWNNAEVHSVLDRCGLEIEELRDRVKELEAVAEQASQGMSVEEPYIYDVWQARCLTEGMSELVAFLRSRDAKEEGK